MLVYYNLNSTVNTYFKKTKVIVIAGRSASRSLLLLLLLFAVVNHAFTADHLTYLLLRRAADHRRIVWAVIGCAHLFNRLLLVMSTGLGPGLTAGDVPDRFLDDTFDVLGMATDEAGIVVVGHSCVSSVYVIRGESV